MDSKIFVGGIDSIQKANELINDKRILSSYSLDGVEIAEFRLNNLNIFDAKILNLYKARVSDDLNISCRKNKCTENDEVDSVDCYKALSSVDLMAYEGKSSEKLVEIVMKKSYERYLMSISNELNIDFNLTIEFNAPKQRLQFNLTLIQSANTIIYVSYIKLFVNFKF